MTVRNLDALLRPRSVALLGAEAEAQTLGGVLARNLLRGGFRGPIRLVHPEAAEIRGRPVHPDVASLPEAVDLAVVATPPDSVPRLIAELGARGTRAVVVTANLDADLRQAALDAAQPHLVRILGPGSLGLQVPGLGLDASAAHLLPPAGGLAFLTQSRSVVRAVIDWATPRGIGFSHLVTLGGMGDVDFGDLLDVLAVDPGTRAILLYVESITSARKFMSAARAAARLKPVIAIKAGRFDTDAGPDADAVYDAAFERAGILRVADMVELFDAVETLARVQRVGGERLAIMTNGGGLGALATDALIAAGGALPPLAESTQARLDAVLPAVSSRRNPVDIGGDAGVDRYRDVLEALLSDPGFDAVLVLNGPTALASGTEVAQAVADTRRPRNKPVLAAWIGQAEAVEGRRLLRRLGLPAFQTPDEAARGFMHLVRYRRRRALLMETPPSFPVQFTPDVETARAFVDAALAAGREWLTEPDAKAVLAAYGIPVVATETAATPAAARAAAARILDIDGTEAATAGVALKILSPDIVHKTDVQGVALDLDTPEAVEAAAHRMLARVAAARPDARLEGFTVQAMVRRAAAHETALRMAEDARFGPVLVFGSGGTGAEAADDQAFALPPLNMQLAHELIGGTRISRLLAGYRGRPAADREAVAVTLVKLSQLVCDHAEIAEIDVNPLLADEHGILALDARIRVRRAAPLASGQARLAIQPYPSELEEPVTLPNGRRFRLRPLRAEDEPALQTLFERLDPHDVRMRFFAPIARLTHEFAARLTQLDYDREMALTVTEPGEDGRDALFGVVRLIADPDNVRAEFAVIVDSAIKGQGLGRLLMEKILDHARRRGITEVWGDVLRENRRMLELCRELGFRRESHPDDIGAVRVVLTL